MAPTCSSLRASMGTHLLLLCANMHGIHLHSCCAQTCMVSTCTHVVSKHARYPPALVVCMHAAGPAAGLQELQPWLPPLLPGHECCSRGGLDVCDEAHLRSTNTHTCSYVLAFAGGGSGCRELAAGPPQAQAQAAQAAASWDVLATCAHSLGMCADVCTHHCGGATMREADFISCR
eukprot:366543-Pelagomonas_calceolata.AAC.1